MVRQVSRLTSRPIAAEVRTNEGVHHPAALLVARLVDEDHQEAPDVRFAGVRARNTKASAVRADHGVAQEEAQKYQPEHLEESFAFHGVLSL